MWNTLDRTIDVRLATYSDTSATRHERVETTTVTPGGETRRLIEDAVSIPAGERTRYDDVFPVTEHVVRYWVHVDVASGPTVWYRFTSKKGDGLAAFEVEITPDGISANVVAD